MDHSSNDTIRLKTAYRRTRFYKEHEGDMSFVEFLVSKGKFDEADFLNEFNRNYYSNSNSHSNRNFTKDAMARGIAIEDTSTSSHKEVDDYLLTDYTRGLAINAEDLVIEFDEQLKKDIPKSNTPGVTWFKGKWRYRLFANGSIYNEKFFSCKSEAELYAFFYKTIFLKKRF